MAFVGFDRGAVDLLQKLPDWDADTYAAEKARLRDGVVEPGAALIEAVAEALDADLTVVRRSSVSPLHRDLRFAPAGSARYKDHLLLTAWAGADKKFSPTLWIRLDAHRVGFASGLAFDPKRRERWREAVAGRAGESLARAIRKVETAAGQSSVEVAGESLKKVPAPWPADHPRADLLRLKGFQIRFAEPVPSQVEKPAFARWCTTRLRRLLPIHTWLVQELAGRGRGR
ncbi:MAG: DUF2461 domain-containing protein [Proteobacteria bacterium]|nr:DUF2461 domain-containing protein [Pseudomonadota bacterium]